MRQWQGQAKAYAPVRDARVAVGVDLTADHVSVALVDLGGTLLRQATGALRFSMEDIPGRFSGCSAGCSPGCAA